MNSFSIECYLIFACVSSTFYLNYTESINIIANSKHNGSLAVIVWDGNKVYAHNAGDIYFYCSPRGCSFTLIDASNASSLNLTCDGYNSCYYNTIYCPNNGPRGGYTTNINIDDSHWLSHSTFWRNTIYAVEQFEDVRFNCKRGCNNVSDPGTLKCNPAYTSECQLVGNGGAIECVNSTNECSYYLIPTVSPTIVTYHPTITPTQLPTKIPTDVTYYPTITPTEVPTKMPTVSPTITPTVFPTEIPASSTILPTEVPTSAPNPSPTGRPTYTKMPTYGPTKINSGYPAETDSNIVYIETKNEYQSIPWIITGIAVTCCLLTIIAVGVYIYLQKKMKEGVDDVTIINASPQLSKDPDSPMIYSNNMAPQNIVFSNESISINDIQHPQSKSAVSDSIEMLYDPNLASPKTNGKIGIKYGERSTISGKTLSPGKGIKNEGIVSMKSNIVNKATKHDNAFENNYDDDIDIVMNNETEMF